MPGKLSCRAALHYRVKSYWNHQRLKLDPAAERFVGNDKANEWLDRPKRGPWQCS